MFLCYVPTWYQRSISHQLWCPMMCVTVCIWQWSVSSVWIRVSKLWVSLQWRWAAFSSSRSCETTPNDECGYKKCIMYYRYVICWAAYLKTRHRKASRTHTHAHEASRHHLTMALMIVTIGKHTFTIHLALLSRHPTSLSCLFSTSICLSSYEHSSPFHLSCCEYSFFIFLVVFKPSSPHLTLLSMYQVLKMPQMACWKHCQYAQCEFSSPLSSSEVTKEGLQTTVTFWVISVRLAREV